MLLKQNFEVGNTKIEKGSCQIQFYILTTIEGSVIGEERVTGGTVYNLLASSNAFDIDVKHSEQRKDYVGTAFHGELHIKIYEIKKGGA